ncbi:MAG: thioredoxin family protein [Streptococcaceae bacterium]|jgi:thiol-disulfide isomerase/thioredoxin|nr:thioredoxin family protein [Streptococcaceae bacterium]
MIIPNSYEKIAEWIETKDVVLFFTAGWCGDCRFIHPQLPEIEAEFPEFTFVEIDRDKFIDLAIQWDIFGIPSFVALREGKEVGRYVNKERKTKAQITEFLKGLNR